MTQHTESTARTGRGVRRTVVPGRWQLTANQRRVVTAHQVRVPTPAEPAVSADTRTSATATAAAH